MKSSKKLLKIAIKKIRNRALQKNITGVPSGFVEIDKYTNGWQPGQLIVIAARPGMGLNAFIKSMVLNSAIKFNQTVAVFSLEQSAIQLMNMMIATKAKITYTSLNRGNLGTSKLYGLNKKLEKLSKAPIFIDDTPSISLTSLKQKIVKLKSEKDLKLVVVSSLQLMTFEMGFIFNRTQELNIISRNLKKIAKELNLPIIVLSQLPDSVEKRKNKQPKLKDLRKITTIERYADIIAFIYRPQYYGIDEWKHLGESTKGQAEFIIAKNRNGWLNNFRLRFNPLLSSFSD